MLSVKFIFIFVYLVFSFIWPLNHTQTMSVGRFVTITVQAYQKKLLTVDLCVLQAMMFNTPFFYRIQRIPILVANFCFRFE